MYDINLSLYYFVADLKIHGELFENTNNRSSSKHINESIASLAQGKKQFDHKQLEYCLEDKTTSTSATHSAWTKNKPDDIDVCVCVSMTSSDYNTLVEI